MWRLTKLVESFITSFPSSKVTAITLYTGILRPSSSGREGEAPSRSYHDALPNQAYMFAYKTHSSFKTIKTVF